MIEPPEKTAARLAALRRYAILDTPPEQAFDEIVQLAAEICDAPIAVINLIEDQRQWFKSVVGLDVRETPIGISICATMLDETGVVVVPDTRIDPRLATNPLITGDPGLHFYAGAILASENGTAFGTLCVLDTRPRAEGLSDRQRSALGKLGRQVMAQLELRLVGRKLAQREVRMRAMAEALPQLMWAGGPNGVPDYYNSRWFDYTGMDPRDSHGDRWAEFVHPEDRAEAVRRWRRAVATGEPYEVEYRLRSRDGGYRWFLGRAVSTHDPASGALLRWLGTCTDIEDVMRAREMERDLKIVLEREVAIRTRELAETNAKLVEEARQRARTEDALRQAQKMEALGQLTAGISHDFNNLLTGIMGSLELVRARLQAGRTADLDRLLQAAAVAGDRAGALTRRLMTFARRQTLDAAPTDVNHLVAAMDEFIRRTVGESIAVTIDLHHALWTVHCDAAQLENALLNLVINARDAMPDGGALHITTSNVALDAAYCATQANLEAGEFVCIEVRDTGTGMSPEVAARVMEPFFTTKPVGQGTGLGMSMLYGFVEQSGGHIRLSTAPGKGTAVSVYLPRSLRPAQQEPSAATIASSGPPSGQTGKTVLVVEDDATVRLLMRERLTEAGAVVIEAADGEAGLRILESDRPIDVLMTDIGLPGLDGHTLAARAVALRPSLKILVVTAYGDRLLAGDLPPGARLMTKPFALADLDAAFRDLSAKERPAR
jgi:PAS domain S-box-containing protein